MKKRGVSSVVITNYSSYFRIACSACDRSELWAKTRQENSNFGKNDEKRKLWSRSFGEVFDASSICIVFSALTLESYINYLGHLKLDADRLAIFDPLKTIDKFVVYTRTGKKKFDRSRNEFAMLRWLFQERNSIVHDKAHLWDPTEDTPEDDDMINDKDSAKAIQTVVKTVHYMGKLLPQAPHEWASYSTPNS